MGISILYQKIIQGGFLYFGNALGLTKGNGAIIPGTLPTQGAFITTDTTVSAPGGWTEGTTLDWKDGSSYVYVDIPPGNVVDEAFLIWGGSVSGTVTSAARTYPVYLITPDNVKHIVTPVTTLVGAGFYSSSANVTSIVSGFTSGNFICGSVPAGITAAATGGEGGGWLLALAVRSNLGGYTYSTLCISNDNYIQIGTNIPIITPASGIVTGKLMTAVIHAACTKGDALILQSTAPFSAPNREAANFFNSIISNNSGDGLPYTNASFGNNNNNPSTRSNILDGRQGLDLAIYPTNGNIPPNSSTYYLDGYGGGAFTPLDTFTNYIAYGAAMNPSNAQANLEKKVDKELANYGDTIEYTLRVVLTGSGSISNLRIIDTIPDNASFVSGSVFLNGVNNPTANIGIGITIASSVNLPYSGTVTYSAKINNSGSFTKVTNDFYVTFTNLITGGTVFTNTIVSNIVTTTILNIAKIDLNKSVDKNYGSIGEILTYTIALNNTGNLNADSAIFIDTLPNDISLIPNTLSVDGVSNSSLTNPVNINLSPFNSKAIKTITFKANVVNTIPNINPIVNSSYIGYSYTNDQGTLINTDSISNAVTTNIVYGSIYSNKFVDKNVEQIGEVLTYTIVVGYFVGNTIVKNVVLIDTLPGEISVVPNSLLINGVINGGSLSSPGINIGTIPVNGVSTVTFKVNVNTVPTVNPINNSGFIKYEYTENPLQGNKLGSINTNSVITTIVNASLSMTKGVSKNFTTKGETLTYTLVIKNHGNIGVLNGLFKDTIPNGTTYIDGTLKLNGVGIGGSPSNISLGNIGVNDVITIEYDVVVN